MGLGWRIADPGFRSGVAIGAAFLNQEPDPQRSAETVTSLDASISKNFSSGGNIQAGFNNEP